MGFSKRKRALQNKSKSIYLSYKDLTGSPQAIWNVVSWYWPISFVLMSAVIFWFNLYSELIVLTVLDRSYRITLEVTIHFIYSLNHERMLIIERMLKWMQIETLSYGFETYILHRNCTKCFFFFFLSFFFFFHKDSRLDKIGDSVKKLR